MDYTIEDKYQLIKESLKDLTSTNPIDIIVEIMKKDFISIHGPEHHFLDGASFLVALHNAGLDFDLSFALDQLANRSIKMPGAMCGYWGVCGAVASLGAAFSTLDETGPLSSDESYSMHMKFTSMLLNKMSDIGGPRCCKRNAYLALITACEFASKCYKVNLPISDIKCPFSAFNKQCIGEKCPFHK